MMMVFWFLMAAVLIYCPSMTDFIPVLALVGSALVGWCAGVLTFWLMFRRDKE